MFDMTSSTTLDGKMLCSVCIIVCLQLISTVIVLFVVDVIILFVVNVMITFFIVPPKRVCKCEHAAQTELCE